MIGYVYLSLALFAGIAKGFCGKKISASMQTFRDCLFINATRMLCCALIGFVLVIINWDFSALPLSVNSIGVYLLSAVGMTTFCVCWMYAYKQDAYIFLNIFTMLGSIVTCFLSFIVYREPITLQQWIGMAILFSAVIIMSKYNTKIKGKLSWSGICILIVGCLGCSVTDFSQKVYMKDIGNSAAVFNFYTYAFGFVILLIIQAFILAKNKGFEITDEVVEKKYLFAYFAMSLFLFLNTSLKTLAAGILPSAQIYPVLQGANLILSGLMAHFLFKEKLDTRSIVAMALAFTGLIIINM